jgi:hypothetical protein
VEGSLPAHRLRLAPDSSGPVPLKAEITSLIVIELKAFYFTATRAYLLLEVLVRPNCSFASFLAS